MFALEVHEVHVTVLFVYPCPDCRGWHKTKKPKRNSRGVTATDAYADLRLPNLI